MRGALPVSGGSHDAARAHEEALLHVLNERLLQGQFFSHRSAALVWGAPLPRRRIPVLQVGVILPQRAPRIDGVVGRSFSPGRVEIRDCDGVRVLSPASTFATLGGMSITDLVAVGDYFLRRHRPGVGRPGVGSPPLATVEELRHAVGLGRWRGAPMLREALELVREDSWSPRESYVRVVLVRAGLPEPELNVDLFDRWGEFLACVDMVYHRWRVVIEYHGEQHSLSFARDVERVERLRAEGWVVIQVTKALANQPDVMVARIARELRAAGWSSEPGDGARR